MKETEYKLENILSITTGILLTSPDELIETLNSLTNEDLQTVALPLAGTYAKKYIYDIYPFLALEKIDKMSLTEEEVINYIDSRKEKYGNTIPLPTPIPSHYYGSNQDLEQNNVLVREKVKFKPITEFNKKDYE